MVGARELTNSLQCALSSYRKCHIKTSALSLRDKLPLDRQGKEKKFYILSVTQNTQGHVAGLVFNSVLNKLVENLKSQILPPIWHTVANHGVTFFRLWSKWHHSDHLPCREGLEITNDKARVLVNWASFIWEVVRDIEFSSSVKPLYKRHLLNESVGFCVCNICLKFFSSLPELNSVVSSETWRVHGVRRAVGREDACSPFAVSLALGIWGCSKPWPAMEDGRETLRILQQLLLAPAGRKINEEGV